MHEENELDKYLPITPKTLKLAEAKITVKQDACVFYLFF